MGRSPIEVSLRSSITVNSWMLILDIMNEFIAITETDERSRTIDLLHLRSRYTTRPPENLRTILEH